MRHHAQRRANIWRIIAARLAQAAAEHRLGLAAMGTFPLAFWPEQMVTPKARYGAIMDDLQMIGYRNMLCGMHVHVEVPDVDTRINLIMRLTPYLPLLLALSTSSPFWQGHLTGLCGYRLAAYDELPRTGLPELFRTNEDYREFVAALVWRQDHPGRELYLVGAAAVAGKSRRSNCASPTVARGSTTPSPSPRCSAAWCARSTATAPSMPASTASGAPSPQKTNGMPSATASPPPSSIRSRAPRSRFRNGSTRCFDFIAEDIDALGCAARDRAPATASLADGTSADRQIDLFTKAKAAGRRRLTAIKDVIDWAARETQAVDGQTAANLGAVRASPCRPGHL